MDEFSTKLVPLELKFANAIASHRHKSSKKYTPRDGQSKTSSLDHNTIGARGELAFAKIMNVFWDFATVGFGQPDFAPNIDIKTTIYLDGKLVVGTHGKINFNYVLMYYNQTTHAAKALGWIEGYKAMSDKHLRQLRDDRPAVYVIEQKELQPMFTLNR